MTRGVLTNRSLPVVEDDVLVARALAEAIRDLGGDVLGPVASVDGALDLLDETKPIGGAVFDLNLQGETSTPVTDALLARRQAAAAVADRPAERLTAFTSRWQLATALPRRPGRQGQGRRGPAGPAHADDAALAHLLGREGTGAAADASLPDDVAQERADRAEWPAQHKAALPLAEIADTQLARVDVLKAAGLGAPDISVLSDELPADMAHMKRNLALEALRRLLGDEIRSRSRAKLTESRRFSERLEQAIARYHTNAVSTVEGLQELIDLAPELRDARLRGRDDDLTPDEVASYDALADSQSAVDALGNEQLKVIAHELLASLTSSIPIDWAHRDSARARLRVLVERILRKHGYPPDLGDAAVQGVLQQAEALSAQWTT